MRSIPDLYISETFNKSSVELAIASLPNCINHPHDSGLVSSSGALV